MITLDRISIRLPHSVDLCIDRLIVPPAGLYLITGDNGCGKTTLVRTILGIQRNYQGLIQVDAQDIKSIDRRRLASLIAYLPQQTGIVPQTTVRDFLSEGLYSGAHSRLDFLVKGLDLNDFLDRDLDTLSGGERQMCRIARSLAAQTPYAFLDEPDSFLSRRNKWLLAETLKEVAGETGIVLVSHEENAFSGMTKTLWDFYSGDGASDLTENRQPQ